YAASNNLGLQEFGFGREGGESAPGQPRFALLLNPDTILPPSALSDMLHFMEERPQAGVAGPRLVRADGSLDRA
ncbi:MAG: glycosyltransferase family 2 protein, partial [Anaerolineae bacterium]|nr:glycosyltransferase family 2 protein [Anaerolineae bacterium]